MVFCFVLPIDAPALVVVDDVDALLRGEGTGTCWNSGVGLLRSTLMALQQRLRYMGRRVALSYILCSSSRP